MEFLFKRHLNSDDGVLREHNVKGPNLIIDLYEKLDSLL
jgi:hypothetical protein